MTREYKSRFMFKGKDLGFWKLQLLIGLGGSSREEVSYRIFNDDDETKHYDDWLLGAVRYIANCNIELTYYHIEIVDKKSHKPIGKQRLDKLFNDALHSKAPAEDYKLMKYFFFIMCPTPASKNITYDKHFKELYI